MKQMKLISERERLGLTQEEVAKNLGISQTLVARMEKGDLRGSDRTKIKMAHFYGTTVGALFFGESNTLSNKNEATE